MLVVCVACSLATACGSSSSGTAATSTTAAAKTKTIVAVGDSVPSGYACHCTPYPELSAQGLTASTGQKVTATNDAVAGYTSANVLKQVEANSTVVDHVRQADVVEVNIGANDVPYNKNSCGTNVECYAPLVLPMKENLNAIVRRVHELTAGRKVLVVLLDYWSVWLGGEYAQSKGDAYVAAADGVTDRVDSAIKSVAASTGSAYVDLRAAFKGPSYAYDETHFLSSDGDHPNAAGHKQIAAATESVITKRLHL